MQKQISQRADVIRSTIYLIELGVPSVAIGAYFNLLGVIGLQEDFFRSLQLMMNLEESPRS